MTHLNLNLTSTDKSKLYREYRDYYNRQIVKPAAPLYQGNKDLMYKGRVGLLRYKSKLLTRRTPCL